MRAEFSERQYELAVNTELLAGAAERLFSVPSPVSEAGLGYDVAMVPAMATIWSILGLRKSATGVNPGMGILRNRAAPPFAASLFVQYKCSEELRRPYAKEAGWRRSLGAARSLPYYRYRLQAAQRGTLVELSRQVGRSAEVCYAAPAFISLAQLNELQMIGEVVPRSDFLPVPEVDAFLATQGDSATQSSKNHVWTYGEAGRDGILCSEPAPIPSFSGESLYEGLVERAIQNQQALVRHLFDLEEQVMAWGLGEAAPDSQGQPRRLRNTARFLQAPPGIRAALNIQGEVSRCGIGWSLALAWPSE